MGGGGDAIVSAAESGQEEAKVPVKLAPPPLPARLDAGQRHWQAQH